METMKMTPQELMKRLRERAEKAKAEGKTTTLPTQHSEFIKKLRERAEKAKAEGKAVKTMPMKQSELLAKLRERAMLKAESLKKVEVNETEKKEE
jgi:arginine utilization protein RocB